MFNLTDRVKIIGGQYQGKTGTIQSIVSVTAQLTYYVQFDEPIDVLIVQLTGAQVAEEDLELATPKTHQAYDDAMRILK